MNVILTYVIETEEENGRNDEEYAEHPVCVSDGDCLRRSGGISTTQSLVKV